MKWVIVVLTLLLMTCGGGSAQKAYKQHRWKGYHYLGTWYLKDEPSYHKERPGVIIYHDIVNDVEIITIMDDYEAIMLEKD